MSEKNSFNAEEALNSIQEELSSGNDAQQTPNNRLQDNTGGFNPMSALEGIEKELSSSKVESVPQSQYESPARVTTREMFPEVPTLLREAVLDPAVDIASAAYNSLGGFINTLDGVNDLATKSFGAPQFTGLDYIKSKIEEINSSLPETESPGIGKFATNLVVGAPLALAEWEMGGAAGKLIGAAGKATKIGTESAKVMSSFTNRYPQFSNVGKVLSSTAVSDATRMGTLSALAEYGESNNDQAMLRSAASGAALGAIFPLVGSAIEVMKKKGPEIAEKYIEVLTGQRITADEIIKADLKTKTPKQIKDIKDEWEQKLYNLKQEQKNKSFEFKRTQDSNIAKHKLNIKDSSEAVQKEIDSLKESLKSAKKVESERVSSERLGISEERMSSNIELSLEQPRSIEEANKALSETIDTQNKALVDGAFSFIDGFVKRARTAIDNAGTAQRAAVESIIEKNPKAGDLSKNLLSDVLRVLDENRFGGENLFRINSSRGKDAAKGSLDVATMSSTLPVDALKRILTSVNQEGRVGLSKMQVVKDEIDTFVSTLYENGFGREAEVMKKVRDVFDASKNPRIRDQYHELRAVNETFSKKKEAYDEALSLIAVNQGGRYTPNTGGALDAIRGAGVGSKKKMIEMSNSEKKLTSLDEPGFIKELKDLASSSDKAVAQQREALSTLKARLRNERATKKQELFESEKKLKESASSNRSKIQSQYDLAIGNKDELLARMKRDELIASTQFHDKRLRAVKNYNDILDRKFRQAEKTFDDILDFAQKEKMLRSWRAGSANPNENVIRNIQNILGLGQIFGSLGGLNVPLIASGTGVMAALSPKVGSKLAKKLIQFSRKPPKEQNEGLKTIRSLLLLQALKP